MKVEILTDEIIEQGRSERGGWSLKQLRLFGLKKFRKGWKRRIVGKIYPVETIERFLELKNAHLKPDLSDDDGYNAFLQRVKD